jgi:hypothetical protein
MRPPDGWKFSLFFADVTRAPRAPAGAGSRGLHGAVENADKDGSEPPGVGVGSRLVCLRSPDVRRKLW